jgi:lipase maturation factor 1
MEVVLAGLDPELVWGLFPRFVGVIYVLAFASFAVQIESLGGSRGLFQTGRLLAAVRRDFPGIKKYFEYPTLLWFSSTDRTIKAIPLVGMTCGVAAIYGGPIGYAGLVLGWMLWLSLEPLGLIFPWDTMLQEVGFLVLFMPLVEPLPSLAPTALPLPTVAFMARWLPLRLMFGFGKDKFIGTQRGDSLYLRGFFVWMPLPNKLAWYAHHAPAWFLRTSLSFMFFAEVIAPILGLFSGVPRLISFAGLIGLSIGIMATGNWGYFNVGYMLLCVALLDVNASIFDLGKQPWVDTWSQWPDVGIHAAMGAMFLISVFYLPNNSWFGRSWVNWPENFFVWRTETQRRIWLKFHRAIEILRWIAPFRIVNGYGVFPPNASPPMRRIPVLEGSADGVHWKQYGYKYMPSFPHSAPVQVAPHHPRVDQGVYYVANGIHGGSLTGNALPAGSPYMAHSRATVFDILLQRVIAGDQVTLNTLGENPFPDAPPKYGRIALIAMTPTRPSEQHRTGIWWHTKRLGELTLPRGAASWPDEIVLPYPETFNPDFTAHKRRAAPLRAVLAEYAAGVEIDRAVIAHSDLQPADVERFWNDFLPAATQKGADWPRVHELAKQLIDRYDIGGLYRMERVFERYLWILHEHIADDPAANAAAEALRVTHFRYHMILHTCLLEGRQGLMRLLAEPTRVTELAAAATDATQMWFLTLLRYEPVMAHVCAFRWSDIGLLCHQWGVPGLYEYYPFLSQQASPSELFMPHPVKHDDGEFTIEGFYPPPAAV